MKFDDLFKYVFLESVDTTLPKNFNIYSVGGCMLAAEIITKKLLNQGITNFTIHEGYVKIRGTDSGNSQHTWIETANGKIDETIRQFFPKDVTEEYIKSRVSYRTHKKYDPMDYLALCEKFPVETTKHYF